MAAIIKTIKIEDTIGKVFIKDNQEYEILRFDKGFPDKVEHAYIYFEVKNLKTNKKHLYGMALISTFLKLKILK